ncbi:MAG: hypothetical protein SFX73_31180 [Kofleriaceae bacterium]|nr:hypothetical protein [Kofleriaceae bacterium]
MSFYARNALALRRATAKLGLALALLVVVGLAGRAAADAEADADRAFQAAMQRAVAHDAGALDAFEALGAARPVTRWTDDAWAEAARLAERAGDYARARRAYAQVLALGSDDKQVERAKAALARLASDTGLGEWDAVSREHERLVSAAFGGGDPQDDLVALEALVATHPRYPRINAIRLALGRGWEEEGERARALTWLRAAAAAEPVARIALIRALIRTGELAEAEHELDAADAIVGARTRPGTSNPTSGGEALGDASRVDSTNATGGASTARIGAVSSTIDRTALVYARHDLAIAKRRASIAHVLWGVLALVAFGAVVMLRRSSDSWGAVGRGLVRPPSEVVFLLPIAAVLIFVAQTGNPLVASAVSWIMIAGVVVTWISGVLLDAMRARGALRLARLAPHVLAVVLAVGAAGYLAVLRSGALDLVLMTWSGGHALR